MNQTTFCRPQHQFVIPMLHFPTTQHFFFTQTTVTGLKHHFQTRTAFLDPNIIFSSQISFFNPNRIFRPKQHFLTQTKSNQHFSSQTTICFLHSHQFFDWNRVLPPKPRFSFESHFLTRALPKYQFSTQTAFHDRNVSFWTQTVLSDPKDNFFFM